MQSVHRMNGHEHGRSNHVRPAQTHSARWVGLAALVTAMSVSGCGPAVQTNPAPGQGNQTTSSSKQIQAVAAENEYANVIKQIGGKYVSVTGIMSNPSTDPHTYEASTENATLVSQATLVVQNGLGYDGFINHLESASPNANRTVIDVAASLGYGPKTLNPHLWYNPKTMPQVAKLIAADLSQQDPSKTVYFQHNLQKFDTSLKLLNQSLADLKKTFANTPIAVTEPVADYLLQAAGMNIKTPWTFQAAVMDGVDPSPQDVQTQENLIQNRQVKVLVYNQQAVDAVTTTLLTLAKQNNVPVVGVYETMPPNMSYQTWMETEVKDLHNAIQNGTSTETIG